MNISKHPAIADAITDMMQELFNSNLITVLLYGSAKTSDTFWDLDMLILLNEKSRPVQDLSLLQKVHTAFSEQTLDLQLFYREEVEHPELFSLDAHGAFFYSVLARAKTLYGENPFTDIHAPSESRVVTSLLNRIQRYIFRARQEYIGLGRYNKDRNPDYHRKHVRRVIVDLMLMHGVHGSVEDSVQACKLQYPNLLTKKQWSTLDHAPDSIETFILLYERIYESAIATATSIIPGVIRKPLRGHHKGLVYEYMEPETKSKMTPVVLVDGLPRTPHLEETMSLIASWGYPVFFPRLSGTWESEGRFLDADPADDIRLFARALKEGDLPIPDGTIPEKVIVIGASFGASVALHAGTAPSITHVIACSPMGTLRNVQDIETLKEYLCSAYSSAYRFTEEKWDALINGKHLTLETLSRDSQFTPKKYSILVGTHDTTTPPQEIVTWAKKHGVETIELETSHLSLHKDISVVRPLLRRLLDKYA